MALWLIMMFAGLLALGVVFYKVWTSTSEGVDTRWFALALVGTLISIVGLIMTMRTFKLANEVVFVPQATIEKKPIPPLAELLAGQPAAPDTPSVVLPQSGTDGPVPKGIPRYNPEEYEETGDGEVFNQEDLNFFVTRTEDIFNDLEEHITMDITSAGEDAIFTQGRWKLFTMGYSLKINSIRNRSVSKNGPGSGRIRQLAYALGSNLTKIARIYHNAYLFKEEPDLLYIAQLTDSCERILKELENVLAE